MKDNESKFAERLSITVSLYQNLIKKFGKKTAYDITCDIIINIGLLEQIKNFESLRVDDKEPMEQLLAFYGFMGVDGVGKYVKRILIEANQNILHYEVRNCYFNRFYKALEVPELTKLFCEIDKKFFQIFSLISSFIGVILLKILKHMEKNSVYFYLREK